MAQERQQDTHDHTYQRRNMDSPVLLQVRVKGKGGNAIGARTSVRSAASMCENFEPWAGSRVRVGVVGTHVHCSCPQLTYQSLPNCNQYLGKSRTSTTLKLSPLPCRISMHGYPGLHPLLSSPRSLEVNPSKCGDYLEALQRPLGLCSGASRSAMQ